jgi:hypothetical protein
MIPQEYLIMYLGANAIALGILALASWQPRVARWLWIGIFVWAATVNTLTAAREPWAYLAYGGLTPSELYRDFIRGWFSDHIQLMVLAIAAGQLVIAMLLARGGRALRLGTLGATVFLLAIAPLGVGSGFPFSLIAIASLLVMQRGLGGVSPLRLSAATPFIRKPDVRDEQEIIIRAPVDLVFFQATRIDLQSLPLVRAIFWLRGRLLGDTPVTRRPLGIVADTMVLGWGLLAHAPGRTLVMGAVTRPWTRNVTFRAIEPERFASFSEPDYVKIAWTLEADPAGPGLTRFRTETRVEATDDAARRKFGWYWLAFGLGIRVIRWNMLRALRRDARKRHLDWLRGHPPAGRSDGAKLVATR